MKRFAIRATVLSGLLAFLHGVAVAGEPTRHIVGVTNVAAGLQAVAAANLHALEVIPQINAIVVEGSPTAATALAKHKSVRYVEPDPPDAMWTQVETLGYGVYNIEAEVVWGGGAGATTV